MAIGAFLSSSNGDRSGTVRIYENISGIWTKMYDDIDGKLPLDRIGYSVSLSADGGRVAIGAPQLPIGYPPRPIGNGLARVYDLTTNSLAGNFSMIDFNIYPNPTSDILNIRLDHNLVLEKLTIYNSLGQVVKTSKESVLNVETLSSGIYFVEVITDQGKATKKVVIK